MLILEVDIWKHTNEYTKNGVMASIPVSLGKELLLVAVLLRNMRLTVWAGNVSSPFGKLMKIPLKSRLFQKSVIMHGVESRCIFTNSLFVRRRKLCIV